jgi:multidrug efflux pump subunit AcrA (membrane-fusion protein)
MPTVPAKALREEAGASHLFVVREQRIEERIVQPGERRGDVLAIVTGVQPGERVVVDPGADVRDGARVE